LIDFEKVCQKPIADLESIKKGGGGKKEVRLYRTAIQAVPIVADDNTKPSVRVGRKAYWVSMRQPGRRNVA
jgi:hypothetical protein